MVEEEGLRLESFSFFAFGLQVWVTLDGTGQ